MSEQSKSAANNIVQDVCKADVTDVIIGPLVILIAIISYLFFAIQYMIIIRQIDVEWGLPAHMIVAVYVLVLIGIFMAMAIYYFIIIRNVMHSKREGELRSHIIDYFKIKVQEDGIDQNDVNELISINNEITKTENPVSPKRTLYLIIIPIVMIFVSMFVYIMKIRLGEFSMIMMTSMFAIGLIVTPSATTFPYEHEQNTIRFHHIVKKCAGDIGIVLSDFEPNVLQHDHKKLSIYTLCTLGIVSIFWGFLLYKEMNLHIISHRVAENELLNGIWIAETGHTVMESPMKSVPTKNKLPLIGSRKNSQ